MLSKLEIALNELNAAINLGHEFPDIVGKIAAIWKVSEKSLTKAYDAQYDD